MRTVRLPLPSLGVVLALTTLSCAGGAGGSEGGHPGICVLGDFPTDGAPPPGPTTLTLAVGTEDNTRTRVARVWQDGDHVPLVTGAQGGYMIRPALDVVATTALPETTGDHDTCLGVRMLAGAPADAPPILIGASARRVPGTRATYHVPPLFGLLSYSRDVNGAEVPVTLDVESGAQSEIGAARVQVTVVPDSALP